jgi:3-hydroxyisobutyryl-CoA hydrolase
LKIIILILADYFSLSGIATHYVPSQLLSNLEDRLSELESDDHEVINSAIEDFVAEPEKNHVYTLGGDIRKAIDRYVDLAIISCKNDM